MLPSRFSALRAVAGYSGPEAEVQNSRVFVTSLPLPAILNVNVNRSVNGIVLCFCFCADGVSRPVGYAPPELSRVLEFYPTGLAPWDRRHRNPAGCWKFYPTGQAGGLVVVSDSGLAEEETALVQGVAK